MDNRHHQDSKKVQQGCQQKKRQAPTRKAQCYSEAHVRLASFENAKAFDRRAQLASLQSGPAL
ncbi:hypothetical protein VP01_3973g11 [Puccinia sorghi]|uniref:Uncharacterized protein n=1 Tax=Puccinia sorghi TaxID=27349 RepID=A0A0L6UT56_9BASI|nr:hypothetical protein VP01_3973g11 [Puccinia sorghi]